MKKLCMTVCMLFIFIFNGTYVLAQEKSDVELTFDSSKQFSNPFNIDVGIIFNDPSLYNQYVFLSYHVYDIQDQELIWEGKRTVIKMKTKEEGYSNIDVDLSSIPGFEKMKSLKIKFDLVDEQNVYWFSKNSKISFSSKELIYEKSTVGNLVKTLNNAYKEHVFISILNIVVFLLTCIGCFYVKKKNIFYN